ncbi:hypothetical protein [Paenibacillus sp. DCT19]|uniref:hypothetical protein n=1 Tax=Paenibacillus sp. DCT19 TaxID=2211212 RepID=UPI000FE20C49|nr:hypothetical protein [Paenibacillus sp. DCT19]
MRYPTQIPVGNRNIRLLKYFSLVLLTLYTVTIVTGCGGLSDKEARTFYKKAVPIGQKYFKKYYDVEIIFTDYDINLPNSSTMFLYGYVKNDQTINISLSLDIPSMEIRSAKGPEDFIKKRIQ